MSRDRDSVQNIIIVAFAVCLVCAVVVSAAAVVLRPMQQQNVELDMKANILQAAGLRDPSMSVEEQFESIETRVINLRTGEFADDIDPDEFNQRQAARNPQTSRALSSGEDIAGLSRLEEYSLVYISRDESGEIGVLILPVRGYGLWSTMYGFLALEDDLNTIAGLGFYEHGETPGLGGEITNPNWVAQWPGKEIYNESGDVAVNVVGTAPEEHDIDAISGATLTSRGVENLMEFWMGEQGFKPFLQNLESGEVS